MCDPYSIWSGAPKHWIFVPEQGREPRELETDGRPEPPQPSGRRGELATFTMATVLLATADHKPTPPPPTPTPGRRQP